MTLRILLQTTLLAGTQDDWTIDQFSLLQAHLQSLHDPQGAPLCHVTARDREPDAEGNDPVLSTLDRCHFDQLWLFALDVGDGLSASDCAELRAFISTVAVYSQPVTIKIWGYPCVLWGRSVPSTTSTVSRRILTTLGVVPMTSTPPRFPTLITTLAAMAITKSSHRSPLCTAC